MRLSVRLLLHCISLSLLASKALAAEPYKLLPSGFCGYFSFRVSADTVLNANLKLPVGHGPFPLLVVLHQGPVSIVRN